MISNPPTLPLTPQQRSAFLDLVDRQFGIRVSDYGASRLDAAVHSVLPNTTCASPDDLLALVETDSQLRWLHDLVEHLTVGETYFLRDPAQVAVVVFDGFQRVDQPPARSRAPSVLSDGAH